MACLPQTKLLCLVAAAGLSVLPFSAVAQITESEINAIVDQVRIPDDDPEIEALVRQAEEAQQSAIDDALEAVARERGDIALGETLEGRLVAKPPGDVAAVALFIAEHREIDAGNPTAVKPGCPVAG